MDLILAQLAYLGAYIKAYWWAILIFAVILWLVFKVWSRAEEYAAGRWAGVVQLVLTMIFFVVFAGLILFAPYVAKQFGLALFKTVNNTIIDIKQEFGDLPPLGTPMPGSGIPIATLQLTPGNPIATPAPGSGAPTSIPGGGGGKTCEDVTPGDYTITYDPSATLRDGPSGKAAFIVEIPKGERVVVSETSCGDGYVERGEGRRVKVTWGTYVGWIHAVCIK